jgi:hypothetical protein
MGLWNGQNYNDDRLFFLDLQLAKKGNEMVWAVTTRRNVRRIPPTRVDTFKTKNEAVEFIKRIEPTTPRISLNGKSPEKPLIYEKYVATLEEEGLMSAMEMFEKQMGFPGQVVIETLSEDDLRGV